MLRQSRGLTVFLRKQLCSRAVMPRRARRGFSLFEAILVLIVSAFIIQGVGTLIAREAHLTAARAESVRVSELARAVERYAQRDLANFIANVASQPTNAIQVTLADLENAGLSVSGQASLTPLRRDVSAWAYAPNSDELYIFVRATGGNGAPPNIPTAQAGLVNIGWVSPTAPSRLNGPGLSMDVSAIQSRLGWPVVNDLVAVSYLNIDADVRPYLYRQAVPGRPELNQMQTDLDMNGRSISNVGSITANSMSIDGSATFGSVDITGSLSANTLAIGSDLSVSNSLTSGSATINGPLNASTATIDTVTAGEIAVTNSISAATASFDTLRSETANSTGTLNATRIQSSDINSEAVNANTLNTNTANVGGTVSANTGQFNQIQTNGCTGC